MLVLRRKPGESIMLGDNIEVVILEQDRNGQIHVGVRAPRRVPVHRREVWDRIQASREHGVVAEAAWPE